MDLPDAIPMILSAAAAGGGAWMAVRIEVAVLKSRLETIEKNAERERARLDSIFRLRTVPASLERSSSGRR